ncbi:30S ribosomal protein S16 [bacterium]|nr:MAG: 30S ribosomal protein S16 [bacterium]
MAVSIRFRRGGRRNRAFYRIVVADSRSPRDGKFIENIGYYDPLPDPEVVEIKKDRMIYWLEKGAQPTSNLKSILKRNKIWQELQLQLKNSEVKSNQEESVETGMDTEPRVETEVETEQGGYDD